MPLFDSSDGLKPQAKHPSKIWDKGGVYFLSSGARASVNPSWVNLLRQINFGKPQQNKLTIWKLIPFKLLIHRYPWENLHVPPV